MLAERAALAALEGGCTLPVAAWSKDTQERDELNPGVLAARLVINAAVFDFDGHARIAVTLHGPRSEPEALGQRAAEALRKEGAIALLERRAPSSDPV